MTLPRLRVSDNGRYFVAEDGKPFFWLADTAWTIFNNLTLEEVEHYLDNRRAKDFNVIQCVALEPEADRGVPMANRLGDLPAHNYHPFEPNEAYFQHMDAVLDLMEQRGFYAALVPAWGQLVVGWDWDGRRYDILIDEHNAYDYGRFLGERYRHRTNLIWILGGDRHPVETKHDFRPVWRALAEGIARGITGQALKWDQPDPAWSSMLMTYHVPYTDNPEIYSSSYWFHDDAWLSFNMLQSGHRAHVRSYSQIVFDYQRQPIKPVLDGEPNYEDMPYSTVEGEAYHDAWDVRKRAYWSVFAGACGHTYGHASIWCMLDPAPGEHPHILSWRGALDRPGAGQMRHLSTLAQRYPYWQTIPDQTLIAAIPATLGSLDLLNQACRAPDGSFALIYLTRGGSVSVDLEKLSGDAVAAQWYDPRTGQTCDDQGTLTEVAYCTVPRMGHATFYSPTHGSGNDWILILEKVSSK